MKGNKKEKIRIGKKLINDNKIILKRIKYCKEGNDYDIDKVNCVKIDLGKGDDKTEVRINDVYIG